MTNLNLLEAARRWQEWDDAKPVISGCLNAAWDWMSNGMGSEEAAQRLQMDEKDLLGWLYDHAITTMEQHHKGGHVDIAKADADAAEWFRLKYLALDAPDVQDEPRRNLVAPKTSTSRPASPMDKHR